MSIDDFARLTDVHWRKKFEVEHGLFVAEGAKVIERAWRLGYGIRDVVTTSRWLDSLPADLLDQATVHVHTESELEAIAGFHVHRGALATFERKALPSAATLLERAQCVVVLDGLVDHENVGAIFRSAAALGADAILITEDCADPLYRRSIKTSMGATLSIPFTKIADGLDGVATLKNLGFSTCALSLSAQQILTTGTLETIERIAFFFGSEGSGLSQDVTNACHYRFVIPMSRGIDSLNVAQTAAIVLWANAARQQV